MNYGLLQHMIQAQAQQQQHLQQQQQQAPPQEEVKKPVPTPAAEKSSLPKGGLSGVFQQQQQSSRPHSQSSPWPVQAATKQEEKKAMAADETPLGVSPTSAFAYFPQHQQQHLEKSAPIAIPSRKTPAHGGSSKLLLHAESAPVVCADVASPHSP